MFLLVPLLGGTLHNLVGTKRSYWRLLRRLLGASSAFAAMVIFIAKDMRWRWTFVAVALLTGPIGRSVLVYERIRREGVPGRYHAAKLAARHRFAASVAHVCDGMATPTSTWDCGCPTSSHRKCSLAPRRWSRRRARRFRYTGEARPDRPAHRRPRSHHVGPAARGRSTVPSSRARWRSCPSWARCRSCTGTLALRAEVPVVFGTSTATCASVFRRRSAPAGERSLAPESCAGSTSRSLLLPLPRALRVRCSSAWSRGDAAPAAADCAVELGLAQFEPSRESPRRTRRRQ